MLRGLSSLLALKTVSLVALASLVSFGIVTGGPSSAWASSDPCVATPLSDAASLGIDGATGTEGTANNPWIVSTPGQLAEVSARTVSEAADLDSSSPQRAIDFRAAHYRQTANIDLGGCLFTPIGFGTQIDLHYDGGGFTISGLRISLSSDPDVGLFSWMNSGSIKNLGLVEVNIVGGNGRTGGLVAYARAFNVAGIEIANVFVTGSVTGSGIRVGGLVAVLDAASSRTAKIVNSYSSASVTNTNNPTGGLVGEVAEADEFTARVTDSYARGELVGNLTQFGGLIGLSSSESTIEASFWDTEASKRATSQGGTGKLTTEMTDFTTFHEAGWAIVDGWVEYNFETPDKVWGICEGVNDDYPFLLWQFRSNPCAVPDVPAGESSGSEGVVREAAKNPAIHLDLKAQPGANVAGAPILMEGEGLLAGSPYSLVLRSTPTTLVAGTVNRGGSFSTVINLPPGIAPGTHTITLSATGADGSSLTLVTSFVVSNSGTFTSINSGAGTGVNGLAATGPSTPSLLLGLGFSLAVIAMGLAVLRLSRRTVAQAQ